MEVELRVSLPDDSVTTVAVLKSQRTDVVFEVLKEENNHTKSKTMLLQWFHLHHCCASL